MLNVRLHILKNKTVTSSSLLFHLIDYAIVHVLHY